MPRCFFRYMGIKTFASSHKNEDFWPKNGQIWPIMCIFGQISAFLIHLAPCPTNKTMRTRCQSGLLICGYQKFCSLPKKPGCFSQKRPFFPQNMLSWAQIGLAGSLGALLVVWFGARAVSRKTPIYFIWLNIRQGFNLGDSGGGENYTRQKISVACWFWRRGQGAIFWKTKFLWPPWDGFFWWYMSVTLRESCDRKTKLD